jgi:hypothetical protein
MAETPPLTLLLTIATPSALDGTGGQKPPDESRYSREAGPQLGLAASTARMSASGPDALGP